MKVLVTGFEPFGGESFNPSGACLDLVRRELESSLDITIEQLPVDWEFVRGRIPELLSSTVPDVYMALGLAGGRHAMAVERVAINVLDFPIADNAGAHPIDEPLVPNGPLAYAATIPVKAIAKGCSEAGFPMYVSNTAGTYLCNAVMYLGLDWAARHASAMRAGFIHLPHATEYVPYPERTGALPLSMMAKAVARAIAVATAVTQDEAHSGGAMH